MRRFQSMIAGLFLLGCLPRDLDVPDVSIDPASPTPDDDLVVTASCEDCSYLWFRDDVLQDGLMGATISSALTEEEQTWRVLVSETDGEREGPPGEASVLVAEPAPSLQISLSSDAVYTDDILEASVTLDGEEADTDSYSYAWMVDGEIALEGAGENSLDGSAYFDKDQEVYVDVTPADGSEAVSSDSVIVLNTAPTSPEISIEEGGSRTALDFDGSNDYVAIEPSATLSYDDALTFEAWVRWGGPGSTDYQYLVTHGFFDPSGSNVYRLHIRSSGSLYFSAGLEGSAAAFDGSELLPIGEWAHVAVVFEDTTWSLFLNGENVGSESGYELGSDGSDHPMWVGGLGLYPQDYPYNGAIDQVRISSTARYGSDFTPDETLESDSDTLGLWLLDEGEGYVAEDSSGNGNDGDIVGPAWTEDSTEETSSADLLCSIDTDSTDADGDDVSYTFEWDVDGEAFTDTETTDYEGDTVPESALSQGSEWTCTVTPNDGDEDGDAASASMPLLRYAELGGGTYYACARTSSNTLDCWGDDTYGQVSSAPTSGVAQIAGQFGSHGCALDEAGSVQCWGSDENGQVSGAPSGTYVDLSIGYEVVCVLDAAGAIDCWGRDHVGQASPPTGSFDALSTGYLSGCAINTSGGLECWGMSSDPPSGTFVDVSMGARHGCALTDSGSVECWEAGTQDSTVDGSEPSGIYEQVVSGNSHSCVLDTEGLVYCWGDDSSGQLTDVPTGSFMELSAGAVHTCGLDLLGRVTCWGDDTYGQVSDVPSGESDGSACADSATEWGSALFGRDDIALCQSSDNSLPDDVEDGAELCGSEWHVCTADEFVARNDDCDVDYIIFSGILDDGDDCMVHNDGAAGSSGASSAWDCDSDYTRPDYSYSCTGEEGVEVSGGEADYCMAYYDDLSSGPSTWQGALCCL